MGCEMTEKKKVLLFSGGTDSFILSKLIKPDVHLYIDVGTEETEQELKAAKELGIEVTVDKRLFLKDQELPSNKIVPMRNVFFVLIAAYYGDEIYLGATKGDLTCDDTLEFGNIMNSLLVALYREPAKNQRGVHQPQLFLPVKHLTKTELVHKYLFTFDTHSSSSQPLVDLKKTRSCYKGGDLKDCGLCSSCFRKWIAYVNNGIDTPDDFLNNPLDSLRENFYKVRDYTGEYADMLQALELVGVNWKAVIC
jgi:7-cyano-7-deazaguanine synthase in queuosine biosynthesis